ncbi:hypothetical protein, partial [Mycoplasmopsis bovis]|uniref:hypothetical protein n=1 Tax=Mycoplasmopsis bovis TaxID=28903 RepID=UPI003D295943
CVTGLIGICLTWYLKPFKSSNFLSESVDLKSLKVYSLSISPVTHEVQTEINIYYDNKLKS